MNNDETLSTMDELAGCPALEASHEESTTGDEARQEQDPPDIQATENTIISDVPGTAPPKITTSAESLPSVLKNGVVKSDYISLGDCNKQLTSPDLRYDLFGELGFGTDDVYRAFLCTISDTYRQLGIQEQTLQASLLIILAMISAMLGFPFALIVVDATSTAHRLLALAKHFIPRDAVFEDTELSVSTLYGGADIIPGRTIVLSQYTGMSKVKKDLEHLVEQGYAVRQGKVTSGYRKGIEEAALRGPAGLITITDDPMNIDWMGSNVIKHNLSADEGLYSSITRAIFSGNVSYEADLIAKFLERLPANRVGIPFFEDLKKHFEALKLPTTAGMMQPLISMISLIAIINNSEPLQPEEIFKTYVLNRRQKQGNWLQKPGYDVHAKARDQGSSITATKIDYYLAHTLLRGSFPARNDELTQRQLRIYKAVKKWNKGYLKDSTFAQLKNDYEGLALIVNSTGCWASREKIVELVNKEGDIKLSPSTIYNELRVLEKKGIVEYKKLPDVKNKFGYYVLTLEAGNTVTLPNPSAIIDPILNGAKVKVMNPITGKVDEI